MFDLVLTLLGLVVSGIGGIEAWRSRGRRLAWSLAAARLGLDLQPKRAWRTPSIRGHIDGHAVRARLVPTARRATGTSVPSDRPVPVGRTRLAVDFSGPPFPLEVVGPTGAHEPPERRLDRLRRRVGWPRVSRGAGAGPGADRTQGGPPRVGGMPPLVRDAYLTPARRRALRTVTSAGTRVENGTVSVDLPHAIRTQEELVRRIRALVSLASALECSDEERSRLRALAAGSRRPPGDRVRGSEGEREPRPASLAAPEERRLPSGPPAKPTAVTGGPPPSPRFDELAAEELAYSLFGEPRPSFEIVNLFESAYAGRRVRWSGRLLRAEPLVAPTATGHRAGTCAEVELLELAPGELVPREVRARVALPEVPDGTLDGREGEELEFVASLEGCDAFLRVLTLGDGRLSR